MGAYCVTTGLKHQFNTSTSCTRQPYTGKTCVHPAQRVSYFNEESMKSILISNVGLMVVSNRCLSSSRIVMRLISNHSLKRVWFFKWVILWNFTLCNNIQLAGNDFPFHFIFETMENNPPIKNRNNRRPSIINRITHAFADWLSAKWPNMQIKVIKRRVESLLIYAILIIISSYWFPKRICVIQAGNVL